MSPAWLCGMALRQLRAGKQRLPSTPTGDAQRKVSRAPSTAHSSQALTDRQTWVGCSHSCSSSTEELEALGPGPNISSSPVQHEHKRSEPDSQRCQRAEKTLRRAPAPPCPCAGPSSSQSCAPLPHVSAGPPHEPKPHNQDGCSLALPSSHCHPSGTRVPPPVSLYLPVPSPPAQHHRVPWA